MSRPLVWGVLTGAVVGYFLDRRRPGAGQVIASPKYPKTLRQSNRLKLPGKERGIGR